MNPKVSQSQQNKLRRTHVLRPAHSYHVGTEQGGRRNSKRQTIAPQRQEPSQVQCIHCWLLWRKPCQKGRHGQETRNHRTQKRSPGCYVSFLFSPEVSGVPPDNSFLLTFLLNPPPFTFKWRSASSVSINSKQLRGGADSPGPPQTPHFIAHPCFPPHLRKQPPPSQS